MSERLHPAAWIAWALATGATILSLNNPLLLVLSIGALAFVAVFMAPDRGPFRMMLTIGLVAVALRTVLFALTGHPAGEILFTVPQVRVPALLGGFTLGGPVAASVVVHSATEGVRLAALLCCVGVFLSVVDSTRVIRLMPRFLFEAGLIVTIAISFVPTLARTARDVRDARRLRGERMRGVRALALAVPILATTLERAVTVAESMEARGYGRPAEGDVRGEAIGRAFALAGIVVLSAGALLGTVAGSMTGWAVAAAGTALLGAGLRRLSHLSGRTRYRRDRIRGHDLAVMIASASVAACALLLRDTFAYSAYPSVAMPRVSLSGVVIVALFAAPVVVAGIHASRLRRASALARTPEPLPVAGGAE